MKWHTEKRKISELIPHPNNPQVMNAKEWEDLENSIDKFDLAEIPAINLDNMIIAGHKRVEMLKRKGRGDEEIEVRVPDRMLTQEEANEYLLRSNKNRGRDDFDLLVNFDEELLKEVGYTDKELEKAFGLEPEKAEVEFSQELSEEHNYIVLYFDNEMDWLHLQTLFPLPTVKALDAKPGYERQGVGRVFKGIEFLKKIRGEK